MATVILVWITLMSPSAAKLWGDEGTYVAMTASLVRDHDLAFDEPDRAWATTRVPGPPVTVILQQTDGGIFYSKPILYPLLAAPFYWFFGEWGLVATNLFFLGLALALTWRHLRRLGHATDALWVLATFVFCSALLPYVGWKMSDLVQAAVTLAGLVVVLGPIQQRKVLQSDSATVLGGVLLGMAVSMRYPTAALVAAVIAALLLHRKLRKAALFAVAVAVTFLAINRASERLIGASNPYKAVRSSFNEQTGYPIEEDDPSIQRFSVAPATQSATWTPPHETRRSAYSAFYFLVGRHTGLIAYFPIALVLAVYCLRRSSRVGLMLLGAVAIMSGFYLLWMPENYFGGSTFIGNRYFLGAFPALLVALRRLPSPRFLAIAWIVAAVSWTSALVSVATTRDIDDSSQSHTRAGVFRLLPFESTAQKIDGLEDRFWDQDFVRSVDPFAKVARWSLRLDSDQPAAELMIATDWPGDSMLFLVSSPDPSIRLEVSDWGGTHEYSFPRPSPEPPGLVEVEPAPAWRKHSFWWKGGDKPYSVRTLRLRIVGADDKPTSAIVRYLGRGRVLAPLAADFLGPDLPSEVEPGATLSLQVRARNRGRRPWDFDTLLPIQLGYRIVDSEAGKMVDHGRKKLPFKIRREELLDLGLDVEWPTESGDYELIVELLRGPAARLGEAGRHTLARAKVRVR